MSRAGESLNSPLAWRYLKNDQLRKLVAAAVTPHHRALVEFMWASGCRISEVVSARMEDID